MTKPKEHSAFWWDHCHACFLFQLSGPNLLPSRWSMAHEKIKLCVLFQGSMCYSYGDRCEMWFESLSQWHLLFDVKVKCPIAVSIGDATGNNSLCEHFISSQSKQLCHECGVLLEVTDNPYSLCHCVSQQKTQDMVAKVIGKEWNDSPSCTLRMSSGISPLVLLGMVCTSTDLQNICTALRKAT